MDGTCSPLTIRRIALILSPVSAANIATPTPLSARTRSRSGGRDVNAMHMGVYVGAVGWVKPVRSTLPGKNHRPASFVLPITQ